MTEEEVRRIYYWLAEHDIRVWIDGGWCIDALLGRQTREHSDLDIAVHRRDNARLRLLFENSGYRSEERADTSEWAYVMRSAEGNQVDVHAFEYDDGGKNIYGIEYPFGSLTGQGMLVGQQVNCIAPEWMFRFKTAYQPVAKDLIDVHALSRKFGFDIPESHRLID